MKSLKISLVVIVITAISLGAILWIQSIKEPETVKDSENQFITMIEQQIEQLKAKPDNRFCKDFYREVVHNINVFYEQNRFDSIQSANLQLKENFEKTLYSVYAEKFISQAIFVFNGSEWHPNDLSFIQSEKNELKQSGFLIDGSHVDREFETIQTVLNKYREIVSFISTCRNFSYSDRVLSGSFPIADVQDKISHATSLLNNSLGNVYVNNCSRLHSELRQIPQILFRTHVRYLEEKISDWSGMYSQFNSQSDYANNLYRPLRAEIEALDDNIYNVSNFVREYNRLINQLNSDSHQAYNYFTNEQQSRYQK